MYEGGGWQHHGQSRLQDGNGGKVGVIQNELKNGGYNDSGELRMQNSEIGVVMIGGRGDGGVGCIVLNLIVGISLRQ